MCVQLEHKVTDTELQSLHLFMASPAEREGRLAVSANARPSEGIKQTKERRPGQFSRHPISQLQGPFEESIQEAIGIGNGRWVANIDAQSRRKILLESPNYERLCGRKWRQRADERQALGRAPVPWTRSATLQTDCL